MVKRRRILAMALASVLLLVAALPAMAATITVHPDRNPVSLNESFRLTFSANGSVDGDPDFAPLKKNFQILGQSQSSQINIINGHFSHQTNWLLEVMAKRPGRLTIPPIHFGSDISRASSVTVNASAAARAGSTRGSGNLFLKVTATPKKPYVQAQVIYTVRLYRAVDLQSASLSAPKPSSGDAVIEKLGKASQYQTQVNGRTYAVIERRYAVFPQQSGTLTIAPVVFDGQVVENDPTQLPAGGAVDQFNNFFNHFNTMVNQQAVHTVRLASSAVTLHVRPIPAAFPGKTWLPAKNLELQAGLSGKPTQWQVGVPVTRTLSVKATGLTAAQLPQLSTPLGKGLKQYPDEPKLTVQKTADGVTGKRLEKVAVIPSRPGDYTLPAISIPWWDTTNNRLEIAKVPARVVHVAAAASSSVAAAAAPPAPPAASPPNTRPVKPPKSSHVSSSSPAPSTKAGASPWLWISLGLAVGWAGSMAAVLAGRKKKKRRRGKSRPPASVAPPPMRPLPDDVFGRLRQACAANDPKAAGKELLSWARQRWPQKSVVSLEDVGLQGGPAVEKEIHALSACLYGREAGEPWQGNPLWQALESLAKPGKDDVPSANEDLEPLYKL